MSVKLVKVAIPTEGKKGLEDTVSNVFGRAKTFTIINMSGKEVKSLKVIENPAVSYKHGAGPIVVKTLADLGINKVITGELGPGVSTLLDEFKIEKVLVEPRSLIREALKNL